MATVDTAIKPGAPVPSTTRLGGTSADTGQRSGLLLAAPFVVLYLLFLIGPLIYGIIMSFFNASTVSKGLGGFTGFDNYQETLTSSDFWHSMWHTVQFTIYTTPPLVIIALALALLTERVRRGKWFYRFAYFAPYVVPSAAVVLVWAWIYAPGIGLATKVLSYVGITAPNWTGSPSWAMISVAILTVWWTLGFNYILYLAGLQDISKDVYDAASLDGAGTWSQMRHITIPLLNKTTALVLALQIVASLKIFDQIYLLTQGGPNFSTRPALEYVYDIGFTDFRAGYAAAASMVYFLVILIASLIWLALSQDRSKES
jgi:multiple sugar transport system permease protein